MCAPTAEEAEALFWCLFGELLDQVCALEAEAQQEAFSYSNEEIPVRILFPQAEGELHKFCQRFRGRSSS